ncbi:formate/nitrite transporter family protein [Aestuariivita sp.]|jgi:formate/nitrite transporter FocA (FNT family)|uniref:formate/nitrite transporter family protein n=1 Tax=Aestuariivita sp. TaxID=1872407 RepID=UPI00216F9E8A|nr:formate/nitrite transporter family protein [Aestuariivita sp.]MCE8005809.1 formate/nitrite transporter family protein [Aestuariivita sp.]
MTKTNSIIDEAEQAALDEQSLQDATKLSPRLIYEVIRRDGEEELERPLRSLVWSGIAAGIMISFSVLGEAIFRTHLPDAPSSYLIENLGYSLGFLLVILGRMQLFTENTITTVLPLMVAPSRRLLGDVCQLWFVVLSANVVGAFAIATVFAHTSAIPAELIPALVSLSEHAVGMSVGESFMRAIPAGILIAAIVWMLPQAENASFFVILIFTWLIAAGDFTHIVAGSVEMAFLAVRGDLGFYDAVFGFFLPVLAGNVVGGTVIFTLMAWGQVRHELVDAEKT